MKGVILWKYIQHQFTSFFRSRHTADVYMRVTHMVMCSVHTCLVHDKLILSFLRTTSAYRSAQVPRLAEEVWLYGSWAHATSNSIRILLPRNIYVTHTEKLYENKYVSRNQCGNRDSWKEPLHFCAEYSLLACTMYACKSYHRAYAQPTNEQQKAQVQHSRASTWQAHKHRTGDNMNQSKCTNQNSMSVKCVWSDIIQFGACLMARNIRSCQHLLLRYHAVLPLNSLLTASYLLFTHKMLITWTSAISSSEHCSPPLLQLSAFFCRILFLFPFPSLPIKWHYMNKNACTHTYTHHTQSHNSSCAQRATDITKNKMWRPRRKYFHSIWIFRFAVPKSSSLRSYNRLPYRADYIAKYDATVCSIVE